MLFLGKEVGEKMTFQDLLMTQSGGLSTQFNTLLPEERDVIVSNYLEAKEKKVNVPKRASHAAIAKAVYSQMEFITTTVCVCIASLTCF
jgi:hypothetical protein